MIDRVVNESRLCIRCQQEIPWARLKALPDTHVCVKCSEEIGGEFKVSFEAENLAKAGSLKKNYGAWKINLTRRKINPKEVTSEKE